MSKGQGAHDGGQILSQHLRDRGFSLAMVTLLNKDGCICSHGWPLITLCMGPMSQGSTAWVVSAYSFMELCQCILSMLCGETFKISLV